MKNLAMDQSASKTDTGSRIVAGPPWLYGPGPHGLGPRDLRAFKVLCVFLLVLMALVVLNLAYLVAMLADLAPVWLWLAGFAVVVLATFGLLLRRILRLKPTTGTAGDPQNAAPTQPRASPSGRGAMGDLKMYLLCSPALVASSACFFVEDTCIVLLIGMAGLLVASALCWVFRDKSYIEPCE